MAFDFFLSLISPRRSHLSQITLSSLDSEKYLGLEFKSRTLNLLHSSFSYSARFIKGMFGAPFRIRTKGFDLFIQQQVDPISVSKHTFHIARLHDVLPMTHSHFFSDHAVKVFGRALKKMEKEVDLWVVDSNYSKDKLHEVLSSEINATVIPCAVNSNAFDQGEELSRKKNKICLIATIEPRKNIRNAIEGFLAGKHAGLIAKTWHLTIAGGYGWLEDDLFNSLSRRAFGDSVHFIDSPSDFILTNIMRESKILLSPTYAEGFGLTPLEGMLFGCLPVVSDIPPHRESLQDLAVYIQQPLNAMSILKALQVAERLYKSKSHILHSQLRSWVIANYSEEKLVEQWTTLLSKYRKD